MKEQNLTEGKEIKIDRTGHRWWLKSGLTWGLLLWMAMSILLPIYTDIQFSVEFLLTILPICFVAGLLFGFGMKLIKHFLSPPND